MRTENMKTRLGGVTILRAGAAMALVAALTACGGGGGGTPPVQEPTAEEIAAQEKAARQTTQRGAISTAIATARGLVDGLDDDSTAADVAAVEAAIAAIRTAIAGAADLEDSETGLNTLTADGLAAHVTLHQTQGSQRTTATNAVDDAMKAVAGLEDGSYNNMQVMDAIEAARRAIAAATDLSDTQTDAYTTQVNGYAATFLTHRVNEQRTAITDAITDARTKVGALNAGSSDADAQEAADAIKDANDAIAAAADIDDTSAYSTEIAGIDSSLTAHNRGQDQRAIDAAIKVASDLVDALNADSTPAEVQAAGQAIAAARKVIEDAAHLTDKSASNAEIAGVDADLTDHNTRETQRDGIETAIAAASADVDGLDAGTSSSADVADARALVETAKKAITDSSGLSAIEVRLFTREITAVENKLDGIGTDVAKREQDLRDDNARVIALFGELSGDAVLLDGYEKASGEALSKARVASRELGTISVDGDSNEAKANAQAILDSKGAIQKQIEAAQKVLDEARLDKNAIDALADATTNKKALETLVGNVIADAQATLADIKADQTRYDRSGYEGLVPKGDDGDRDPQLVANAVAEAISGMLGTEPSDTFGAAALHEARDGTTVLSDARRLTLNTLGGREAQIDKDGDVVMVDGKPNMVRVVPGFTFEDIFGSREIDLPDGTTVASITATGQTLTVPQSTPNGYTEDENVTYQGIPVILECDGTCTHASGTLSGDWKVDVVNRNHKYERDGSGYVRVLYAEYGYWLGGPDDKPTLALWTGRGEFSLPDSATNRGDLENGDEGPESATFTGGAFGMSVHDTNGAADDGKVSGHFEADVSLTATFSDTEFAEDNNASQGISGIIDNFRGGENVDAGWSVKLEGMGINASAPGATSGGDNLAKGSWTNRTEARSDAADRPELVHGAFDALFGDGNARGVYIAED